MSWDRILTINDYYDGPRLGIAEVNAVPHIYEAEFDYSADEYSNTYFVSPVDEGLLSLVLEDWAIWLRWHAAHGRNEVTLETHPALPAERERHEAIKMAIGDRLRSDPKKSKRMKAEFRNLLVGGAWTGTEVRWSESDA
jgi:hypothetical protein